MAAGAAVSSGMDARDRDESLRFNHGGAQVVGQFRSKVVNRPLRNR